MKLVIPIAVFLLFFWLMARWLPRKMSGWDALAKRFPSGDVHKFGSEFRRCTGYFGRSGGVTVKYGFCVKCAQEGLCVTANFARGLPILIPWSAVREIRQVDNILGGMLMVFADYESQVHFNLPKAALMELQKNIPANRFR
jgi:hypothetical protein